MSLPLDALDVYKGGLPVGFDSVKAANRPLCEFFTTPKPLPVGIRTADAVPKVFKDAAGGEYVILAAVPLDTPPPRLGSTWGAVIAVADREGCIVHRGITRGSDVACGANLRCRCDGARLRVCTRR